MSTYEQFREADKLVQELAAQLAEKGIGAGELFYAFSRTAALIILAQDGKFEQYVKLANLMAGKLEHLWGNSE